MPLQAAETEASRSSGSTVPATAGQTQQRGMGLVDQLVGQIDQLAETLVHLPPPSPKAAFATRAQGQAAQTVAQQTNQQHQPEAPGAPGHPEESWRLEMLDAINQMQLMVSLLQTSLLRMARTVQRAPHGP